jgi:Flp pilus assembly protein TadD
MSISNGKAALASGRFVDAEFQFRQALMITPNSSDAMRELGFALFQQNRMGEALAVLEEAVQIAPGDLLARLLIGRLFLRLQEPAAAEKHFQRILKKVPASEPARSGLVDAALALRRLDEAERLTRQMLTLNPRSETGLFAAARVAEMQNDHCKALDQYDKLLKAAPDNPNHRYHRSRTLLRLGRFDEGWREYECRFAAGAAALPTVVSPKWAGPPINHLLLISEQGLGDTIQFARFIPLLKPLARRVTLACPATLVTLLTRSFDIETMDVTSTHWPEHDAHLPLMSLPHALTLGRRTLDPVGRYLRPDVARTAEWARKLDLNPARLNVGVVCATSVAHATEQRPQTRRSCMPADLATLAGIAGIDLIDLQVESNRATGGRKLPAEMADFDDTAAVIDQLDIVLAVDTAVAHVAGALGKPLALLLPFVADWRWMQQADRSDWYPSAHLFRQAKAGDWSKPVGDASALLKRMAEEKQGPAAA